jgi:hypothetical protein
MAVTINGSTGISTPGMSSTGNVTLAGASVKVLNNSGNPVVPQTGSVLKVQQFADSGVATTSTSVVSMQTARFSYTPASASSTLYFIHSTDSLYGSGAGYPSGGLYGYWYLAEYLASVDTAISPPAYLYSLAYSSAYGQVIRAQSTLQYSVANSATTTRIFNTTGATSNANMALSLASIKLTIIEVAA